MSRLVWLLALFGLVSGCATPTLYSWGHYEELVYVSYAQPGKVSPEMQVEKLEEDYQKARANNKRMHPGFRSEEHTSELQSHSDLVCRLLLEKKKTKEQVSGAAESVCTGVRDDV